LGGVYACQDELEVAINHHKKSVEINPDYAEGYNNLGIAFQKLGLFEEAIKNYKKGNDFYMIGGMGHSTMVTLGVSLFSNNPLN